MADGFITIDSKRWAKAIKDFEESYSPQVVRASLRSAAGKPIKEAVKKVVEISARKAAVKKAMVSQRIGIYMGNRREFQAMIYVRGAKQRSVRFSMWNYIPLVARPDTKSPGAHSLRVSPSIGKGEKRRGGLVRGTRGYKFGVHVRPEAFWSGQYKNFYEPARVITQAPTWLNMGRVVARKTTAQLLQEAAQSAIFTNAMNKIIDRTLDYFDRAARSEEFRKKALRKKRLKAAGQSAAKFLGATGSLI